MNSIESTGSLGSQLAAFKQAVRQFRDPLRRLGRLDALDQLLAFTNLQLPLVDFDPFDMAYPAGASAPAGATPSEAAGLKQQASSGRGTIRAGSSGGRHETLQNHAVRHRPHPHPPDQPERTRGDSHAGPRAGTPDRGRPPSVSPAASNGGAAAGSSPSHSGTAAIPKAENGRPGQSPYGAPGGRARSSPSGEVRNEPSSKPSAVPMPAFKRLNELTRALLTVSGRYRQADPFVSNRPLTPDSPAPDRPPAGAGGRSRVVGTPPLQTRGSVPPRQVRNAPVSEGYDTGARPLTGAEQAVVRSSSRQRAKNPSGIEYRKAIALVGELTAVLDSQSGRSFSPATATESPARHDKPDSPSGLPPNAPDRSGTPIPAAVSQAPGSFAPVLDERQLMQRRPCDTHLMAEQLTDLINDVLVSQARRHGVDV